MSNLHNHALAEFRAAGWMDADGKFKDEMQEAICKHVLELLKVFADEGHSGSTNPNQHSAECFEDYEKATGQGAALVAAAEREACAKVCEAADKSTHPADLADAIRAREKL